MPLIGGDIYGGDLRVEHAVRCQTDRRNKTPAYSLSVKPVVVEHFKSIRPAGSSLHSLPYSAQVSILQPVFR